MASDVWVGTIRPKSIGNLLLSHCAEGVKMKLSKVDIDNMAKALSDKLLCSVGLRDGKRVASQVKRNLLAEDKRRKNL